MKKQSLFKKLLRWSVFLTIFLILAGAFSLYVIGQIKLFKTYGPAIGLTENILLTLSLFCVIAPLIALIFDVSELRSRGKRLLKAGEEEYKYISNSITGISYNYSFKNSDGANVIEGSFFEVYYYEDHKKVKGGKLAVSAIIMFITGVKGSLIAYLLLPALFSFSIF